MLKISSIQMTLASMLAFSLTSCENAKNFQADPVVYSAPPATSTTLKPYLRPENPEMNNNGQTETPELPPPVAPPTLPPPVLPPPVLPPIYFPPPLEEDIPPQTEPPSEEEPDQGNEFNPFSQPNGPQYESGSLHLPITPVANMEKGYQATNPGFRAVLKNDAGQVIAAGPMTVEAAMNGQKTPSAPGNPYPRLIMNVELKHRSGAASSGSGVLKICLAEDPHTPYDQDISCKRTGCYDHDRPCGYTGRTVDYSIEGDSIRITRWGSTGAGGLQLSGGDADSPTQAALSAYHAAKDSPFVPTAAWEEAQSPLVVDLNKNKKIELISFHDNKVAFDLNASGQKTITGWASPSDGLLCIDLNGNGQIDNGRELFGEYSARKNSKQQGKTFDNGFAALAQYDSNLDQSIDSNDRDFERIRVWQDKNSNGVSDKGELMPLSSAGVKSISLFFERAADENFVNMHADNDIRLIGEYRAHDGTAQKIVDVWFRYAFGVLSVKN